MRYKVYECEAYGTWETDGRRVIRSSPAVTVGEPVAERDLYVAALREATRLKEETGKKFIVREEGVPDGGTHVHP